MRKRIILFTLLVFLCACTASPIAPSAPTTPRATSGPTPALTPTTIPDSTRPVGVDPTERWIEVDLQQQKVRLHEGNQIVGEYLAATGVNSEPKYTTFTGLFRVQVKDKGPIESVPGVYVTDMVEFDMEHGNAFHSMPMDKQGKILDDRLGQPITAGCVRVSDSAAVFDFATLGMKVWIH